MIPPPPLGLNRVKQRQVRAKTPYIRVHTQCSSQEKDEVSLKEDAEVRQPQSKGEVKSNILENEDTNKKKEYSSRINYFKKQKSKQTV